MVLVRIISLNEHLYAFRTCTRLLDNTDTCHAALDYIQLIDLDLLLALAAYDDNRALENITDRVSECRVWPLSL